VIYASGAIWLGLFVRTAGRTPIGVPGALALGVYPFVAPDLMKLLVAASILPGLWRLFGRTDAYGPDDRR
jgi:biotin transporter BioY